MLAELLLVCDQAKERRRKAHPEDRGCSHSSKPLALEYIADRSSTLATFSEDHYHQTLARPSCKPPGLIRTILSGDSPFGVGGKDGCKVSLWHFEPRVMKSKTARQREQVSLQLRPSLLGTAGFIGTPWRRRLVAGGCSAHVGMPLWLSRIECRLDSGMTKTSKARFM